MSESKQYPLSENKKKELRKKGVVPYCKIVIPSALLAVTLALIARILTINSATIALIIGKIPGYLHTDISDILLLAREYLLSIIGYSLIFLIVALVVGLLQTGFLFLFPRRYAEGIRETSRRRTIKGVLVELSVVSILIAALGAFVWMLTFNNYQSVAMNALDFNLKKEDLATHLTALLVPLSELAQTLSVVFLVISVFSLVMSKIRYLNTHRMSRDEIIGESDSRKANNVNN